MQTIQKPLLFIGGGNMAHAIISGAIGSGVLDSSMVAVLDPDADRRMMFETGVAGMQEAFGWLSEAGQRGCEGCGIVLAVKPQMLSQAVEPIPGLIEGLGCEPSVISILAGTRSEQISNAMHGHGRVVRVMPNTPAQLGQGMTAIAETASSTPADMELADRLFGAVGETVRIDESMMDAFTAVAGSGPAYVFYLVEAMTKAAESLGFDAGTARRVVEQTVTGSASLLCASDDDAATLRGRVTSKNGTTHAATTTLDERRVMDAFVEALAAARDRGVELGREG